MIFGILLVEKGNFFKESTDGITLNEEQFIKYYADINAVLPIEKEDYFVNVKIIIKMVISTWGLTTGDEYVSPERIKQLETIFFEKVRQRTFTKESESKTILETTKYYDIDG